MQPRTLRRLTFWGIAAVGLIWISLLAWKWPFTSKRVLQALEQDSNRTVIIGSFHGSVITPGYVAENLTFGKSPSNGGDAFTIRKLVIVARWSDLVLMQKRIKQAVITGLRMRIVAQPAATRQRAAHHVPPRFSEIGELKIEDAAFDFTTNEADKQPLTITLQSVSIAELNRTNSSPFRSELSINEPLASVRSKGRIGPWNWSEPGKTPLSGSFVVGHADLSPLEGVAGKFTGSGEFRGPLSRVACTGSLDAPLFQVQDNPHKVHLSTRFDLAVNGLNGDTALNHVESQLDSTAITTQGAIKADSVRPGKNASLRFSVDRGRVEDFLFLFGHADRPSMTGALSLRADVDLPPGQPGFLKKVQITGDFEIDDGRFGSLQTQKEVNHLSKSAEGMSKKEENVSPSVVFSDLKGHVAAQNGMAFLSHASWSAPDASAALEGTYSLLDTTLNINGLLRTTGKLSDTTSGLKTVFLKVATPFWKKNSVTTVPFTITGKTRKPVFALSMKKHTS